MKLLIKQEDVPLALNILRNKYGSIATEGLLKGVTRITLYDPVEFDTHLDEFKLSSIKGAHCDEYFCELTPTTRLSQFDPGI